MPIHWHPFRTAPPQISIIERHTPGIKVDVPRQIRNCIEARQCFWQLELRDVPKLRFERVLQPLYLQDSVMLQFASCLRWVCLLHWTFRYRHAPHSIRDSAARRFPGGNGGTQGRLPTAHHVFVVSGGAGACGEHGCFHGEVGRQACQWRTEQVHSEFGWTPNVATKLSDVLAEGPPPCGWEG